MTKIVGAFRDYADPPETCNNYAEDIVLGATAQTARQPAFVLTSVIITYTTMKFV